MDSKTLANILGIISVIIFTVNPVSAIMYIPAIPDKNKTLSANDGELDGCNSSRFLCVMGGEAVLDKQTGLTWLRDSDIAQKKMSWTDAVNFCQNLEKGTLDGRTAGLAKMSKDLKINGDKALAQDVARKMAESPSTVVLGESGVNQIAGIGAAFLGKSKADADANKSTETDDKGDK